MPTSQTKFSRGYLGGPKKPPRKPTVVTVSPKGNVTGTGPGAPKAVQKTKQGIVRVRRIENTPNAPLEPALRSYGQRNLQNYARSALHQGWLSGVSSVPSDVHNFAKQAVDATGLKKVVSPDPRTPYGAALTTLQLGSAPEAATTLTAPERLAQVASDASTAKTAGQLAKGLVTKAKTAPGRAVTRVKTAPARTVARVKATPAQVKALPAQAKKAATTPEGRRAAAMGARKAAAHHPLRSGAGATAVSPVPLPGKLDKRVRGAAIGTGEAIWNHPWETAQTTARALPAAITGPAALLESAGLSAIHGNPKYLTKTAEEQAKGVGKIASDTFSGDPKKAEMAARKEGSLAFVTPLPALTRLHAYERGRGAIREAASTVRGKLASKSESLNRKVRHAPKGTDQHVFGVAARHHYRKLTALIKQRADNPARVANAHHENAVLHAMAKAPKGSHVALQTLAEHGIRDAKGAELVRRQGPGDAQLIKALDHVAQHPETFKSKGMQDALAALEKNEKSLPATKAGKGERARLLAQGDLFGHTRPEDIVPHAARPFTSATDRAGAWQDAATADKQIAQLRRAGRAKFEQAKVLKGAEAKQTHAEGKALFAEARKVLSHNQQLVKALAPFTRPWHKADNSARTPYNGKMLAEYRAKVEASRKEGGLARAMWTHHAPASGDKGAGIEGRHPANMGRLEHMRMGGYAKADNLDRSLEGLVRGTIHMPRLRGAAKTFGRELAKQGKLPFTIDGKKRYVIRSSEDWKAITGPKTKDNPNGGQYDPRSVARLSLADIKNAINDPYATDAQKEGNLSALLKDAEQGKVPGAAPSLLLPREMIKEARLQINPEHGPMVRGLNVAGRIANRGILGTNPAWEISQVAAEGIPMLLAHPELLNPAKLASIEHDLIKYRRDHPEDALAMQATAGATPVSGAALRQPLDMQETYTPALWDKSARAMTRGATARAALSFSKLRSLGKLDALRQNEYRKVLYAAEADKRFRTWHSNLTNLFDSEARISGQFKGKSRAELWNWLQNDPKGKVERTKLEDYVDNVAGNWTAFTHFERNFAPAAIFYGFIRYSLRWPLWTFPKTHPITATIAYLLGQQNSNQLEKLIGGKPSSPLPYAYPIYSTPSGEKAMLPAGSRISPGQSQFTQALQSGNPAQILSSANPFLAAGLTGLTGVEPLSGEKSTLPRGYAAIKQLLSMPAPIRVKTPKGTPILHGKSISQEILEGLGAPEQSVASKAFEQFDPNKSLRSLALPMLPLSAARFKESEALGKAFNKKYENPTPSPLSNPEIAKAVFGPNEKGPDKALVRAVIRKIHDSEAAGELVKKAEEPFYSKGSGGGMTKAEKTALREIEEAYKTGPKAKKKGRVIQGGIGGSGAGTIGGSTGSSIGGVPLGGSVGGGTSGGSIGGRPIP